MTRSKIMVNLIFKLFSFVFYQNNACNYKQIKQEIKQNTPVAIWHAIFMSNDDIKSLSSTLTSALGLLLTLLLLLWIVFRLLGDICILFDFIGAFCEFVPVEDTPLVLVLPFYFLLRLQSYWIPPFCAY